MDDDTFDFVRYRTKPRAHLIFTGRPIFVLGRDEGEFKEFEADSVRIHKSDDQE